MRAVLIALLALAACAPPPAAVKAQPEAAGCAGHAQTFWAPDAAAKLAISAAAEGPNCANAVATLVVRAPNGDVLLAEAYPVAQVMGLGDQKDGPALSKALAAWIDPAGANIHTTADLPDWAEKAETPMAGEFPFYPDDGVDRATYLKVRSEKAPVYCYVQGMESLACWAFKDGALAKIGLQTFPG